MVRGLHLCIFAHVRELSYNSETRLMPFSSYIYPESMLYAADFIYFSFPHINFNFAQKKWADFAQAFWIFKFLCFEKYNSNIIDLTW